LEKHRANSKNEAVSVCKLMAKKGRIGAAVFLFFFSFSSEVNDSFDTIIYSFPTGKKTKFFF